MENKLHVLNADGEGKGDRKREGEVEREVEGKREGEGKRGGSMTDYWKTFSQPLIKAVHDLETLSSAVQISSSPAVICPEGIILQQDLLKVYTHPC